LPQQILWNKFHIRCAYFTPNCTWSLNYSVLVERESDADCFSLHENGVKLDHELLHRCPQQRISLTIFLAFSLPSMTKSPFLHQWSEIADGPIGPGRYCHLPNGSMNVVRSLLSLSCAS
jgi:hypothetical protein